MARDNGNWLAFGWSLYLYRTELRMKKIHRTAMIIILLFIGMSGSGAQQQNTSEIDSLISELRQYDQRRSGAYKSAYDLSDSTRVKILNQLSAAYWNEYDVENTRKYAVEALEIAEKIGYEKGLAKANMHMGNLLQNDGKYAESIEKFLSAMHHYEKVNNGEGIGSAHNNIGLSYYGHSDYDQALEHFRTALKIFTEIGHEKKKAIAWNNIGNALSVQGKYEEAIASYAEASKIHEAQGDRLAASRITGNIGVLYNEMGRYEEALKIFRDIAVICEEEGNTMDIGLAYYNISTSLGFLGRHEESKAWIEKALPVIEGLGNMDLLKECYFTLTKVDSALGDYRSALEHHKRFVQYRDSLSNDEVDRKMIQTQMAYEYEKKEAENRARSEAELKRQKLQRNFFIGGFAFVLLFAGVLFRQIYITRREKRKSDALLLNILPEEIAQELKTSGTIKAKAYTMVTVMFTDFKDFTTVSEKISAELLVDEIHHCFSAFDTILQRHRIEKIKTIGDAYMCASGIPVSNYTHAADMINAAIEIRRFMINRRAEKEARGEIPFDLRIGIHTGPVVAGIVGVKKYAYDIWGDTVNIAARMEQNSDAGRINISGSTYELVKDKFNCEYRGKIPAKNKGEIDMYFVLSD
jgi:class 3 adenylate cyclase/Tfp pilus assembly protein PilF